MISEVLLSISAVVGSLLKKSHIRTMNRTVIAKFDIGPTYGTRTE